MRRGARAAAASLAVVVAGVLTGCTGHQDAAPDASAVVSSLGAVPVPSAAATDPTPTSSPGHPQVLAMGAPVEVDLPDGTRATLTATGPDQAVRTPTSAGGGGTTPATVTVTASVTAGTLVLAATDLECRDENGSTVPLSPVDGTPAGTTVAAGQRGVLTVRGTFSSGAAALAWRSGGTTLAVWDFVIELD